MQLIEELHKILTDNGISVAKFSTQAHIKQANVYKWLDETTPATPKHDDVIKIREWMKKFKNGTYSTPSIEDTGDSSAMLYTLHTPTDRKLSMTPQVEQAADSQNLATAVKDQAKIILMLTEMLQNKLQKP